MRPFTSQWSRSRSRAWWSRPWSRHRALSVPGITRQCADLYCEGDWYCCGALVLIFFVPVGGGLV
eukprot:1169524-Rhodomonas_salina.1